MVPISALSSRGNRNAGAFQFKLCPKRSFPGSGKDTRRITDMAYRDLRDSGSLALNDKKLSSLPFLRVRSPEGFRKFLLHPEELGEAANHFGLSEEEITKYAIFRSAARHFSSLYVDWGEFFVSEWAETYLAWLKGGVNLPNPPVFTWEPSNKDYLCFPYLGYMIKRYGNPITDTTLELKTLGDKRLGIFGGNTYVLSLTAKPHKIDISKQPEGKAPFDPVSFRKLFGNDSKPAKVKGALELTDRKKIPIFWFGDVAGCSLGVGVSLVKSSFTNDDSFYWVEAEREANSVKISFYQDQNGPLLGKVSVGLNLGYPAHSIYTLGELAKK